ncbi:MAG: hypothetical protein NT013_06720 [Planctomycetia bacterium]|nr:hypothetical protein [Planctomycetia bacterium]
MSVNQIESVTLVALEYDTTPFYVRHLVDEGRFVISRGTSSDFKFSIRQKHKLDDS